MRLMGDFWLGLLGFRGAVLAQDRCIGFQDRLGRSGCVPVRPWRSYERVAVCWSLNKKKKYIYIYIHIYIYIYIYIYIHISLLEPS